MTCLASNLLRRTAVAIAPAAVSLAALPAAALTVTLTDSTSGTGSCTYSGMSVDPAGNVSVTCSSAVTTSGASTTTTTPTPPGPGTFNVVLAATTMAAPAAGTTSSDSFTITRTNGTTGNVTVPFAATGGACVNGATFVVIADGSTVSEVVPLTIVAGGTCTVTLSTPSAGTIGIGTATLTVGTSSTGTSTGGTTGGGVPIVAGCPTPDASTQMGTLPAINSTGFNLIMPSGNVTSFPLLAVPSAYPQGASVAFGETPTANSPSVYTMDVSIGPCPGVFNQSTSLSPDYCDWNNYAQQNGGTFSWSANAQYAPMQGWCFATDSTTGPQEYINVRYHYSPGACRNSAPSCGFSLSVN